MARIMTKGRPVIEGSTGIKFSEIIVVAFAIAGVVIGVRAYLDYRHGPTFALSQYMGAVKAGNVENQYALIDETDKKSHFPTRRDYARLETIAHGYTERIENTSFGAGRKNSDGTRVTIPMTNTIRATSAGKQLYQNGATQSYSDNIVMRKDSDGNWRVLLSASVDSKGKLNMEKAEPSPESVF
jgi:hypothetical protein